MQERNTTEQWYRLRRLELAGIRLPHPPAEPNYPLRVEHLAPTLDYDIFPTVDGVGVAISVQMTGGAQITVSGYRLSWGELELSVVDVKPLQPCPRCSSDYEPRYCFNLVAGHKTISERYLQKQKIWAGGTFKRDVRTRGCFLGLLAAGYRFSALVVPATLHIIDPLGNQYPYPLRLKISPELKSS